MSEELFAVMPYGNRIHTTTCQFVLSWRPNDIWFDPDIIQHYRDIGAPDPQPPPVTYLTRAEVRGDRDGSRWRRCQICVPDVPEYAPPPARSVRTGLGWPLDDGTCAAGYQARVKDPVTGKWSNH